MTATENPVHTVPMITVPRSTTRTGMTVTARRVRSHSIVQFGDYVFVVTGITPGSGRTLHVTAQRAGSGPEHRRTFTLSETSVVDVVRL